jgi:hypothetical protein
VSSCPTWTPSQPQESARSGAVVHQEGGVALLRDRPQRVGGAADGIVVGAFEAQLHAGDVAGIERLGQGIDERRRLERRRGDEIEAAHASPR